MTITVSKPEAITRSDLNDARNVDGTFGAQIARSETINDFYAATGMAMFRNKIINGDMRVWQRGTSITTTGGAYTADMVTVEPRTGTSTTVARSTDVPFGEGFAYSLRAYATGSLDDGFHIRLPMELPATGIYGEFQPGTTWTFSLWAKSAYEGRPFTPSMWLSSGAINNPNTSLGVPGFDTRYLTTYWKKYTWTVTLPVWTVDSGSLSSVTCLIARLLMGNNDTPSDYYLTGIQFEKGGQATPFEFRPYATELQLCQRYYYRVTGSTTTNVASGGMNSSSVGYYYRQHPVVMRAAPTMAATSSGFTLRNLGPGADCTNASLSSFAEHSPYSSVWNMSGTAGAGSLGTPSWVTCNSSTSYMEFTAEL